MKFSKRVKSARKRGVSPIIATILLVAITVVLAAVLYVLVSGYMTGGSSAPKTFTFTLVGSGTLGTTAAYPWALLTCVSATPCNTYNHSVSASSGLTNSMFGLKILTTTGGMVSGWVGVIWSSSGIVPLAVWNSTTSVWACPPYSGGQSSCPVGGLQDTSLMIITHPAQRLAGTGDTLKAYGLGSASVSGQSTF